MDFNPCTLCDVIPYLIVGTNASALTDGEGDIFVKLNPGTPPSYIDDLCQQYSAENSGYINAIDVYILHVSLNVSDVTININSDPLVNYAQQPRLYFAANCDLPNQPNDYYYNITDPDWQWSLKIMDFENAWACSHGGEGGDEVIVRIIDTGVKLNHEDLQNHLYVFTGEEYGNGIDDDLNGFIDDRWGYDFVRENDDVVPGCLVCGPPTQSNHGTLSTGIAAAETNNEIGIASGSWGAKFLEIQASTEAGIIGTLPIILSIDYAVRALLQVQSQDEIDIILVNFGSPIYGDIPFKEMIDDAVDNHNALIISPVGNKDHFDDVAFPAGYHRVVGVGGTAFDDLHYSNSVEGQWVDISAPAFVIFSTESIWNDTYGYYGTTSGTSFAGPHVIGASALCKDYFASNPQEWVEFNADTLRKALYVGADWDPYKEFDHQFGIGRLDAYDALKYRNRHYVIAKLHDPVEGEKYYPVNQETYLDIIGTALAKNIDRYELYLDDDPNHPALTPEPNMNIERLEEVLGTILLNALDDGAHTLKLKVCRSFGQTFGMEGGGPPHLHYRYVKVTKLLLLKNRLLN